MLLVTIFLLGFTISSNAALHDRGSGMIYDDVLDVTWLRDANYSLTSGYDSDGRMNWNEANLWVDQLSYGGYEDWRLPRALDGLSVFGYDGSTTSGFNIISSELGYMHYVNLGNLAYRAPDGTYPQPGWGLSNTGPFLNVTGPYWFGTEYAANTDNAWAINLETGNQYIFIKTNEYNAWAVRDGDSVPIPGAILLLGSGLLAVAKIKRGK